MRGGGEASKLVNLELSVGFLSPSGSSQTHTHTHMSLPTDVYCVYVV